MLDKREAFEKELAEKLFQRSKPGCSEEQVLLKAFKFFDLNDNNTLEFSEFIKALERVGMPYYNKSVIEELFKF